jgi:hypothetical protein
VEGAGEGPGEGAGEGPGVGLGDGALVIILRGGILPSSFFFLPPAPPIVPAQRTFSESLMQSTSSPIDTMELRTR